MRTLLEQLSGAIDGEFQVGSNPYLLGNGEIDRATRIMTGLINSHLPIVYISSGFNNEPTLNVTSLSRKLSGMAHVVVEPNRAFSQRLQLEVGSENVYGGTIGIYWPDASGHQSIFPTRGRSSQSTVVEIEKEIRAALLNRRPLFRCTKASVQQIISKCEYERLVNSNSTEVDKYITAFDSEIKAKETQLAQAENEIIRLRGEIKALKTKTPPGRGINLKINQEQDFYPDELLDFVLETISETANRAHPDSRRAHIFSDIVRSNNPSGSLKIQREEIKRLLRDYRSMDNRTRSSLEQMGFSITEDGKHYKLVYRDDQRYRFTLAKTGSDSRGGLNSASDISKVIF